jgi:hypothetical protein
MNKIALTAAVLGLVAVCVAGAADPVPVRVWNVHGAEHGRSDSRPANLVLSEFTTARRVAWRSWGLRTAVGVGKISGTWCLPACRDKPYRATITLSAPHGGYFTKFRVDGGFPRPEDPADTVIGTLATP